MIKQSDYLEDVQYLESSVGWEAGDKYAALVAKAQQMESRLIGDPDKVLLEVNKVVRAYFGVHNNIPDFTIQIIHQVFVLVNSYFRVKEIIP